MTKLSEKDLIAHRSHVEGFGRTNVLWYNTEGPLVQKKLMQEMLDIENCDTTRSTFQKGSLLRETFDAVHSYLLKAMRRREYENELQDESEKVDLSFSQTKSNDFLTK